MHSLLFYIVLHFFNIPSLKFLKSSFPSSLFFRFLRSKKSFLSLSLLIDHHIQCKLSTLLQNLLSFAQVPLLCTSMLARSELFSCSYESKHDVSRRKIKLSESSKCGCLCKLVFLWI